MQIRRVAEGGLRVRPDGAGAAKGGSGGSRLLEVGGVASGGLHDTGRWGREAQSGVGEACGSIGGSSCLVGLEPIPRLDHTYYVCGMFSAVNNRGAPP